MIASLTALALTVLTTVVGTQTDTTFSVQSGERLEVNAFAGEIAVRTWSRNAIRVTAEHSSQAHIVVSNKGSVVRIDSQHRRGIPTTVEYQLTVPKGISLSLTGVNTDMSVTNTEGEVAVETVQGDVEVSGGTRIVKVNSVEGDVSIVGASGKIEAHSVNADVSLLKCSGPVVASSVNGDVLLKGITSGDVEASTINGEVSYEGQVKDGGSYNFNSHNGTISMVLPERSNAAISVATYSGEFSSTFPVQISETKPGKRFNFTLGNGSARVELASFQGDIQVMRPGDVGHGNQKFEYTYSREKQKEMEKQKKESQKHEKSHESDDEDN